MHSIESEICYRTIKFIVCRCARVRACVRACVCVCACTFQPGNFTGWGSEGVTTHTTSTYKHRANSRPLLTIMANSQYQIHRPLGPSLTGHWSADPTGLGPPLCCPFLQCSGYLHDNINMYWYRRPLVTVPLSCTV